MKTAKLVTGLVIVAVLLVLVIKKIPQKEITSETNSAAIGQQRSEVRDAVLAFGERIQNVSLLSPTVSEDIAREYESYLSKSLLASWVAHPDRAVGKETSSPWPDHIDIIEIMSTPTGGFSVRAMLVYMTSEEVAKGGDAGSTLIELMIIKEDEKWKIDGYTALRRNGANVPLSEEERPQLE